MDDGHRLCQVRRATRVLHLNDRLSARGGADWHLIGVLAELAKAHDVRLAVAHDDGTAAAPCPVDFVKGLDARDTADCDVQALVDEFRPDVVHVHNVMNPTVIAWASTQVAVMTVQDHRTFCPFRGKWTLQGAVCTEVMEAHTCKACFTDDLYFDRIWASTNRRLDAMRPLPVIVLSNYMKQELVLMGLAPQRVHVIPPFVHGLDHGAEADGPPCVLFAGRLVETKGVTDAVEAYRQSGLPLPLVIAGTGRMRNELERAGVEVVGWLGHDALSRLYRRAQVVLFPSRWQEPFGIVGLEAMTMGVPVAAYDSGGVRDWHRGRGLVPWGDVAALAGAARALAGARVDTPPGFEATALTQRLVEVYERLQRP